MAALVTASRAVFGGSSVNLCDSRGNCAVLHSLPRFSTIALEIE